MKFLVLLTIFSISLKALSFESLLGGVSGGGGYVIDPKIPLKKQDPKKVEKHIRCVKHPIFHYLEFKKQMLAENKLNAEEQIVFSNLLKSSPNIFDAFKTVELKIEDSNSCFDFDKNEVDGSYLPQLQDHVCISASNIAKKVDFSEVKSQSAALIIHEYSEVLGQDEAFAVTAQKITLSDFKKWESQNISREYDSHCDHE